MVENWLSSGEATAEAIVSGSAPGREAETTIVGKSTFGSWLTGRLKYPNTPKITSAAMSNVVNTSLRMNSSEIFIDCYCSSHPNASKARDPGKHQFIAEVGAAPFAISTG